MNNNLFFFDSQGHNPSFRWDAVANAHRLLKKGIWLYFFLIIFEGALRKWLLPDLATPLLIIRDPLALWLVVTTWKIGLLPKSGYLSGAVLIGILGIYAALLVGHGNFFVAMYGARAFLLHFPLIFVIGRIFDREDVIKIGKVTLWLVPPMTVLIAFQFYSPQSAFVNRGVGGDLAGAGFGGALGFFRPPGTFSFTNGTTLFYGFATGFILFFLLNPAGMNRLILVVVAVCLVTAIPLTISRGLFFQIGVGVLFAGVAMVQTPTRFFRVILVGIGGGVAIAMLSQTIFFQTATDAFSERFTSANEIEGGLNGVLGGRFLRGMLIALTDLSQLPLLGYGLGISTNVGVMLLPKDIQSSLSDQEWERIIHELGPLLGVSLILLRVGLSFKIGWACYRRQLSGDMLPWMLLSFGFVTVVQAQWAQPTSLGFCTLIGGLMIASLRLPRRDMATAAT